VASRVRLFVFHDERRIRDWLYHGFVICEADQFPFLRDELFKAKAECCCAPEKRIHFSELTSTSHGSSKTRTAVKWVRLFVERLYETTRFYLLGVHLSKIDYGFFGPPGDGNRDFRIYNRFFEIGLFAACRYFFDSRNEDVEITQVFAERRDLHADDPFLTHAPHKINSRESNIVVQSREVVQIVSTPSREKDNLDYAHVLNFADVLVGSFSEVIDYTTKKSGCREVAQKAFPICRRLTEQPRNANSRYYKRCALSFFPKQFVKKSAVADYGVKPPDRQFYTNRKLRLYQPECLPGFQGLIA